MAGGIHDRVGKQIGRSTSVVQNLISSTGGVRLSVYNRRRDFRDSS